MPPDTLQIFRTIIPATRIAIAQGEEWAEELLSGLADSVIFDCRQVPVNFIVDTGIAFLEDVVETKGVVDLPYNDCYFEFSSDGTDDAAYYACAWKALLPDEKDREPDSQIIPTTAHPVLYYGWCFTPDADPYRVASITKPLGGVFTNYHEADGPGFEAQIHFESKEGRIVVPEHDCSINSASPFAKYLIAGVMGLLSDHLLIESVKRDPKPYINGKRRKKGEPPISGDIHLLTIDVPRVRYVASQNTPQGGTHASPMLHWRRGHRRVLAPLLGQNEPRVTWVRRCLVGDPAKGYAKPKGYRLRYRPPGPEAMATSSFGETLLREAP